MLRNDRRPRSTLMRSATPQPRARAGQSKKGTSVPPLVGEVLRSGGEPLAAGVRHDMEARFGHDFGKVRVFADERAAASAHAVDALAYTVGRNVVFGEGQYAPATEAGKKLLAHELTHTVQQSQADVRSADRIDAPGGAREREAARAASPFTPGSIGAASPGRPGGSAAVLQRAVDPEAASLGETSEVTLSLEQLWAAVIATTAGKKFLEMIANAKAKEPSLKWGACEFRGAFVPETNTIILNKSLKATLNDNEWKQVLAMELGNAANAAGIVNVRTRAVNGELSRDEFIRAIESIEFDSRLLVINAYEAGEFCTVGADDCPAIFDVTVKSFEKYIIDPRGEAHRESYGVEWDEDYKEAYEKAHK